MKNKSCFIIICLLFLLSAVLGIGCGRISPHVTEASDVVMGTILTQMVYGEDSETTVKDIRDRLMSLEQETLSKRLETAEIARINKRSQDALSSFPLQENMVKVAISEELSPWMEQIFQLSKDSDGTFDVTLGTLTTLWNIDEWATSGDWSQYHLPTKAKVEEALKFCGYEKITRDGNEIAIPAGMELDLGAVGKGIACDEVAKLLTKESKIKGAVISVGGSILTFGEKPDGTPWKVGIVHPRNTDGYLGWLSLKGQWCISTSGDYERYVEVDGIRYHHILNPFTGYPADNGVISVTILSKSGLISDALSTACFVLGPEKGLQLAEAYAAEAVLMDETGEIYLTEGMSQYFTKASE
jgi:thiamine biosynthesis lipoprotein